MYLKLKILNKIELIKLIVLIRLVYFGNLSTNHCLMELSDWYKSYASTTLSDTINTSVYFGKKIKFKDSKLFPARRAK